MALQECSNGHIYDSDLHNSCPYCDGGSNRIDFGEGNDSSSDIGRTVACSPIIGSGNEGGADIGKTVAVIGRGSQPADYAPAPGQHYEPRPSAAQAAASALDDVKKNGGKMLASAQAKISAMTMKMKQEDSVINQFVGAVKKKGSEIMTSHSSDNGAADSSDPVGGWLVCTEGPEKGRDYRILCRNNTLGSSNKMDICLRGLTSTTAESHARIAYDRKHNVFHIIPTDSTEVIYVNDEPVYVPTGLKDRDVIEIGGYKLVFIPFCGEIFSWEKA